MGQIGGDTLYAVCDAISQSGRGVSRCACNARSEVLSSGYGGRYGPGDLADVVLSGTYQPPDAACYCADRALDTAYHVANKAADR